MTERKVLLQGLGKSKYGFSKPVSQVTDGVLEEEAAYLDLQGNQSDHCCAEGERRGQVWAQVEEGKPIGYTRGTNHAHHLKNKHKNSQKKKNLPGR